MTTSASPSPTIFLGFLKNSNRRCSRSGRGMERRSVPVNDCIRSNRTRARAKNRFKFRVGSVVVLVFSVRRGISGRALGRTFPAASNVPKRVPMAAHEAKAMGNDPAGKS
jgi:hypothetical protein